MVERGILTLKEILSAFPPEREKILFTDKEGKTREVVYCVSRDPKGLILHAAPETEWLERVEEQKNQAIA